MDVKEQLEKVLFTLVLARQLKRFCMTFPKMLVRDNISAGTWDRKPRLIAENQPVTVARFPSALRVLTVLAQPSTVS